MPGKPFEKGKPRGRNGGRKAGIPNQATMNAREAIARFVDANVPRMQGWLDEIAADPKHGPMAAMKCVQEVIEYHVPKLQRTELVGNGGGPIVVRVDNEDLSL